jgi:hypothetical protein
MPLYMCSKCGSVENTALGGYWRQQMEAFEAEKKHEPLCSACDPSSANGMGSFHGDRRPATSTPRTVTSIPSPVVYSKHMGPFTPVVLPTRVEG